MFFTWARRHPNRAVSSAVNAREARQRALSGFFCGERIGGTGVYQTAFIGMMREPSEAPLALFVGAHVGADDFCCCDFAFDVGPAATTLRLAHVLGKPRVPL